MILKHEIVVDLPIPFFLLSQIKTAEDEDEDDDDVVDDDDDEEEEWGVRKLQERDWEEWIWRGSWNLVK